MADGSRDDQGKGREAGDGLAMRSATELAAAVKRKEIGAVELLDHYLARVERHDGALNAIVVRDFDRARERAKAADAALARGEDWGPLHGVPMTVKESYNVAGLPTTWGVPEMRDNIARTNALAVDRMLGAGAIIFGKTNVPYLLSDLQSYNKIYGTTNNPWDLSRGPGGSSGGSAAALAAGMTGLEIGSDIGGSIRNPAHFCGVYGHKPTWGILSPRGHSLLDVISPTDISVIGPLARSAQDLALAVDLMSTRDPLDAPGLKVDLKPARAASLKEMRVAVWRDDPIMPVGREVAARMEAVVQALRGAGVQVTELSAPPVDNEETWRVFQFLLFAALMSRQPDSRYAALVAEAEGIAPEDFSDKAMVLRGGTARFREWSAWNERRARLRARWAEFFRDVDIMLAPVTVVPAFPHQQEGEPDDRRLDVDGEDRAYFRQIFWAGIAGVSFLPSTVFPAGLSSDGLPVGLQAIGPEYGDRTCIAFAAMMADLIGGFRPPPGYA